jgi:hypothetical protein
MAQRVLKVVKPLENIIYNEVVKINFKRGGYPSVNVVPQVLKNIIELNILMG